MPSRLGAFILSKTKKIMNNFITEINEFHNNRLNYGDTDSMYIEKKSWNVFDEAKLFGKQLCHGQNDYNSGGVFYRWFLAPKVKKLFNYR